MDHDVLVFSQVMATIVMSTAAFVVIGLGGRWLYRLGQRDTHGSAAQSLPPAVDARLQSLEHAVEAIAIEVERISEGQRFTVSPVAVNRSITPH